MAVVLHHCAGCIFIAGSSLAVAPHVFFFGCLGVEVFFALSGFCLAFPILRQPADGAAWRRYAWHRVRRIVPPAWGAMLIFIGVGLVIRARSIEPFASAQPVTIPAGPLQTLAMFLFWGRVYLNSSYWALALEARWYFALPLMLYALGRFKPSGLLAGSVLIAAAFFLLKPHLGNTASVAIGPLPLYLPLFALGILAAWMGTRVQGSGARELPLAFWRAGLVSSIILVVIFTRSYSLTPSRILPSTLLGFFLLMCALKDPAARAFFSWPPLVWIGGFSYSLYLLHEVLINLCVAVVQPIALGFWEQALVYFVLVPTALLPLAFGFHLILERPFLRSRKPRA
jgi:peptidoglycan/LPS O-acetylase OafA/YrhL